jgi:PilZ domain
MSNPAERRKGQRIEFERAIDCRLMAIDGTWGRDCKMLDVSETGCRLTIEGSIEGLALKEFFLVLTSTGLAYRRCELSWVNGDQLGAGFVKPSSKSDKSSPHDRVRRQHP